MCLSYAKFFSENIHKYLLRKKLLIHEGNGKGSKNIIRRIKPEIPFAKRHVQNIRTKRDREKEREIVGVQKKKKDKNNSFKK